MERTFSVRIEVKGWLWWKQYWVVIYVDGKRAVWNGPYDYRCVAETTADYNRTAYRNLRWTEVKS